VKVAVTGAAGGIGRALVRGLTGSGFRVRGLVRSSADAVRQDWVCGDIRDTAAVRRLAEGADVVIHAAALAHRSTCGRARTAALFQDVNVRGTEQVCRAAVHAGVRAVMLVSSSAVYGRTLRGGPAAEGAACLPDSAYGLSKLDAERVAHDICSPSATRLTVLRLATVYGPGTKGNITRLVKMARRGIMVAVAPGTARKSLVFVDDVVRVCVALAGAEPRAETLNVADSPGYAVRDIVAAIRRCSPRRVRAFWLPGPLARLAARGNEYAARARAVPCIVDRDAVRALTEDSVVDVSQLRERLGGAVSMTGLETGIREMLLPEAPAGPDRVLETR
jgi:UDP-glucose 4-epimerase